jgi:hypothetical protein
MSITETRSEPASKTSNALGVDLKLEAFPAASPGTPTLSRRR